MSEKFGVFALVSLRTLKLTQQRARNYFTAIITPPSVHGLRGPLEVESAAHGPTASARATLPRGFRSTVSRRTAHCTHDAFPVLAHLPRFTHTTQIPHHRTHTRSRGARADGHAGSNVQEATTLTIVECHRKRMSFTCRPRVFSHGIMSSPTRHTSARARARW
jgi:hypothetical protein